MNRLTGGWIACVRKEFLLLGRDLHGLALLFVMPLAFVLVMSLALQNQFAGHAGGKLKVVVLDLDQSDASRDFLSALDSNNAFKFIVPQDLPDALVLEQQLRRGDFAFSVQIAAEFGARLLAVPDDETPALIQVGVAPDSNKQIEAIFLGSVGAALGRERMRIILNSIDEEADAAPISTTSGLTVHYAYADAGPSGHPSAVQQSVPAWLVFGAFFVVVPLSNTLIRERQQGMLRRLRSTNLGSLTPLLGKLAPYFVVNQLQVLVMLLAGRYVVPILGGETLQINGSPALLALMAAALSLCALGLALLIAVSASTTEQATLVGGAGNIILAALGGIMIPKFVMPVAMQHIAQWSPMSWGLEGFLDVMLRSGGLREIAPEALGLTMLGLIAILLAWFIQSHRSD